MTRRSSSVIFLLAACCVLRSGQGKVSEALRGVIKTLLQFDMTHK